MILCCSKMSEVNAERNSQVDELTRGKKGENEKETTLLFMKFQKHLLAEEATTA